MTAFYHIFVFTTSHAKSKMMKCAGIAALQSTIPSLSEDLLSVKNAEMICAYAKIAVFICPVQGAIAVKRARNLNRTRIAPIFATGFLWTQNTAFKAKGKKRTTKSPTALRGRHSTIYSNNHG